MCLSHTLTSHHLSGPCSFSFAFEVGGASQGSCLGSDGPALWVLFSSKTTMRLFEALPKTGAPCDCKPPEISVHKKNPHQRLKSNILSNNIKRCNLDMYSLTSDCSPSSVDGGSGLFLPSMFEVDQRNSHRFFGLIITFPVLNIHHRLSGHTCLQSPLIKNTENWDCELSWYGQGKKVAFQA